MPELGLEPALGLELGPVRVPLVALQEVVQVPLWEVVVLLALLVLALVVALVPPQVAQQLAQGRWRRLSVRRLLLQFLKLLGQGLRLAVPSLQSLRHSKSGSRRGNNSQPRQDS